MRASLTLSAFLSLGLLALSSTTTLNSQSAKGLGVFEGQSDIGNVTPPGVATYSPKDKTYTITANGPDIWGKADDLHFVWKKVSGDVSLDADIDIQSDGVPHRKAVLMIRQSLDADSAYVSTALHGDRMTAIQQRASKDDITKDSELHFTAPAPTRFRIEKQGDTFTMSLSEHGEPLHSYAQPMQVHLDGSFYVGIGVCSHDKNTPLKVVFSNVVLKQAKK